MKTFLLTTTLSLFLAGSLAAADCSSDPACGGSQCRCCQKCGGAATCQIVCEMKKVKKTVWTVECEEFCPMLPGCGLLGSLCCKDCGRGCDCGECGVCSQADCRKDSCDACASLHRPIHEPKCGKVRTRKTLVKKEITCEVPSYKTVVVCCGGCGASDSLPSGQEAAPLPARQAAVPAPLPPLVPSAAIR